VIELLLQNDIVQLLLQSAGMQFILQSSCAQYIIAHREIIALCSMPFVFAFSGWITNVVALHMTFYPLNFWGIPPYLGWQGIAARKSAKISGRAVDLVTEKLINIQDVFERVNPKEVSNILEPVFDKMAREKVERFFHPTIWRLMPGLIKSEIINLAKMQAPRAMRIVIQDINKNIYELFDIKGLVVDSLTGPNVHRLINMFQTVGHKEFKLIKMTGLYIGFLLGLLQMAVWVFLPWGWLLPLEGLLVGGFTNVVALWMIFRPLRPKKILGFNLQGVFIKRQPEVARAYADIVANQILTPDKIMTHVIEGPQREMLFYTIRRVVGEAIDRVAGAIFRPFLYSAINTDVFERTKHEVVQALTGKNAIIMLQEYGKEALDIENTITEKFTKLPPEEYEWVLRTAFKEDEWILLLVGAILGGIISLVQWGVMAGI